MHTGGLAALIGAGLAALAMVEVDVGAANWAHRFGYRPVLAETFVDSSRYTGHCYRTANWLNLGQTTGRS